MFTQPVVMRCTLEQYERDLKIPLQEIGYKEEKLLPDWGCFPYLTTKYNGRDDKINNTSALNIRIFDRYIIKTYNPQLFLALASMTDAKYGIKGEWWKPIIDTNHLFRKNILYKCITEEIDKNCFKVDSYEGVIRSGSFDGKIGVNKGEIVKATKEELIKFLSKDYTTEVCVIPEKWSIRPKSKEEIEVIGKYFNELLPLKNYETNSLDLYFNSHNPEGVSLYDFTDECPNFLSESPRFEEITFEQFKQIINQKQNKTMTQFKITRTAMKEIYDIACSTWKSKIETILSLIDIFSEELILSEDTVQEMFEAANSTQKETLYRVFPTYKEDKNPFIREFIPREASEFSKYFFGNKDVITILHGATPRERKELKGKAFLLSNDYDARIAKASDGERTYIEIFKK